MLHLIIEKFAEVLHVDLRFLCVYDRREAVELDIGKVQIFDCLYDIAQFADAGRFDEDAVRMKLLDHLFQCFAEISDQTAADAARIHFIDLYAGIFEEAAVNADLAEFVFDQHNLLTLVSLFDQLLDQCRLAGAQKSRKNIYLYHLVHPSLKYFNSYRRNLCYGFRTPALPAARRLLRILYHYSPKMKGVFFV